MGMDRAPASVTAPRIPAMVVARFSRWEGLSVTLPSLCALRSERTTATVTQAQRTASSATVMTST